MRPYFAISCCVLGLYGLMSGNVLPGLFYLGAGLVLAVWGKEARTDPR